VSQTTALHQAVQWKDRRWVVQGVRLKHGKAQLACDDGDLDTMSIDDFRHRIAIGEMVLLARDESGSEHLTHPGWRETEGDHARLERERRQFILAHIKGQQRNGSSRMKAIESLGLICKEKGYRVPQPRTIRRWMALARGHQSMLSPQWHRCGNAKQGPTSELTRAMEEVIGSTYLDNDRLTVTELWNFIQARYRQICEELGIAVQSRSIKVLRKYLRNLNWTEEKFARLPTQIARSITRTAVEVHWADYAWELVQVDATSLDILVCDDRGVEIGRPTLYAAIDTATGYIVGLHLTILKPSALPFVELLKFMYFKKPDGFDEKYGIQHRREAFGKPVGMKVDNGSEFIGAEAVELVRVLHGDTARCQPFTPQEKPHIERFNGVLTDYVRTLPGSTKSAVTRGKPRTPPKGEKLLTVEELRGRIYRFVYDDYCLRINDMRSYRRGKALSPASLWKEHSEQYMPPFPMPVQEFERALHFKKERRILQHYGIDFESFQYSSDELAELYQRFGRTEVEFLYSELDAVRIHVKDPDDEDAIIVAICKELQGQCVDRKTAKEQRRDIARAKVSIKEVQQDHVLGRLEESTEDNRRSNTSRARAKQARKEEVMRQARDRAARGPASKPALPQPQHSRASSEPRSYQFDTDKLRGRQRGARKE
jgi:putative transposase